MKPLCQLFFTIAFVLLAIAYPDQLFAQRGKDGVKLVTTANNVVNEYTTLNANAAAGTATITVANSTLNATGRFPGALAPGDLLMIIQLQGATILGAPGVPANVGTPNDSTWGQITNYNDAGNNEFAQVYSVPNATTITLDCALKNNYTASGKVLVVRVPRYSSLTINNGASITCDPWNGTLGGVCAIEVQNNTTINTGGSINATGRGFRGGQLLEDQTNWGVNNTAANNADAGAEKGEGIAGYQSDYTPYGGMYCRGAPANGGGGGNAQNAGGGGGANGGNPVLWNGHGMPDISVPAYSNAWNLQYAGFATQTSSGGGQGGYTFSGNNQNPTVVGPGNNALWGGDSRNPFGGYGGRPLDYSTGRLFLGGGGGSGDQNNVTAGVYEGGAGANGGGLVYLMNYGTVSILGTGQIVSNGNIGSNTKAQHRDGAGGGGAGGTIIVNSVGTITGGAITANGGNGGNQLILATQAEGPGGGGSGGYIAISNGAPVLTTNGGANGTTTSTGVNEFPPNGATKGGTGSTGTVSNFIINSPNVTICAGQSTTLNATPSGTVPGGTTFIWYDSQVAGSVIGNGNSYITPVLATGTYTYYAGTCPGTYHQPVVVTVTSSAVVSAGTDVTICSGTSTTLNASGGTGYSWAPAANLSNPNISNPVATPVSTTTYVVTVSSSCPNINDTVVVTVNSSSTASVSPNTTICSGSSATLSASGGGNYSWTTGETTDSITVAPTITTTYSVIVGTGSCADTASTTVTIGNSANASINGPTGICTGGSATLTASGGNNYSWTTGETTAAITVTPTATTTYSVTVSSGSCSSTTSITVNVGSSITASIGGNDTVCGGVTAVLTASGGSNYSWSTGETTGTISITPPPSSVTTYSLIAFSGTCSDTTSITVTTLPTLVTTVAGNTTLCAGDSSTLTASVNASSNNSYSWSTGSTNATIIVTPTQTSTYTVIGSSGSCSDTAFVTVTVTPPPTATVSPNTTICAGQSAALTASGGTSYSWSTGDVTPAISVSPLVYSTYTVIVSAGTCSDTDSVSVSVLPSPTVTVTNNTTICGGDVVTLNASGATSYSWSNGATSSTTTASPASTITYSVVATSGTCSDTGIVIVTVSPPPVANISGNSNICQGFDATLTATGGGTYVWSSGETTAVINPTTPGIYSVTVTIGSCTATDVINTSLVPNPNATVSPDITITQGQTADLTATGGMTYVWDNGDNGTTINVSPPVTTVYCVTVYDANNCYDTACVTVFVESCSKAGALYLPNAFSPNEDGENDELQIYYDNFACIKNLHLVLYNRWGEKIFETNDPAFKWNGDKYGTGVYAYQMRAEIMDGIILSKKGNVSLIK